MDDLTHLKEATARAVALNDRLVSAIRAHRRAKRNPSCGDEQQRADERLWAVVADRCPTCDSSLRSGASGWSIASPVCSDTWHDGSCGVWHPYENRTCPLPSGHESPHFACVVCDGSGTIGHYLGEGDGFDEHACDACDGTGAASLSARNAEPGA